MLEFKFIWQTINSTKEESEVGQGSDSEAEGAAIALNGVLQKVRTCNFAHQYGILLYTSLQRINC
jgi:hypothetical protein